jgi:hypothetical protein
LLALKIGKRGQRLPDWHFDPPKHELVQMMLKWSRGVDAWKLYEVLSQPHEQLNGRAPIDAVTLLNVPQIAVLLLSALPLEGNDESAR